MEAYKSRGIELAGFGVVFAACSGQFMVVLDVSVVNVALPDIRDTLGFRPTGLQWVVNAYVLVLAGALLLGGRLADIYGRRRVFILGLVLFSVSSLFGGLATSPEVLLCSRAAQGLGAAVLAPATLTIITTSFPEGRQRIHALAAWTAVGVGGGAAGNIIGGGLTELLSWRWILLINVPFGVITLVLAAILLTPDPPRETTSLRLDTTGAILATLGLAALTFFFTRVGVHEWLDPITLASGGFTLTALALFVFVEGRLAEHPIMPLRLFKLRSVSVGNSIMLLAGACLMPMWYFLTLLMQNVLGYGPLKTGFAFLPHTLVTILVGIWVTPWLMYYVDSRKLICAGSLVAASGFLWQGFVTPESNYLTGILGPAFLISVGGGFLNTPITSTVTSGVPYSDAGAASGIMNTAKQAGGAIGLAILVAVTSGTVEAETPRLLAGDYALAFHIIAAILTIVAVAVFALPANSSGERRSRERRQ